MYIPYEKSCPKFYSTLEYVMNEANTKVEGINASWFYGDTVTTPPALKPIVLPLQTNPT